MARLPLPMASRVTLLIRFLLLWLTLSSISARSDGRHLNPYEVLGVPKDATQAEIRRQYRQLCLRFHPDKNVDKPSKERERCEDIFKRVQQANSQIGDDEARRQYDTMSSYSTVSSSPFQGRGSGLDRSAAEAFYRAYYGRQETFRRRPSPFYVNGVDVSGLFSQGPFSGPAFWSPESLKSIYIQKVKVPLQDLYTGRNGMEFVLQDNVWKRYRAAFRGGVAMSVLYQGVLFSLPMLRLSLSASLILGAVLFHLNLPRPTKLLYDVNIQRGWKSGTRLTFKNVEPGFDIVFVLEEGRDERFVRVDNDLHTTVSITSSEAKRGCSKVIEPLGDLETPITLDLRANEVTQSGQKIAVKGRGWPKRSANNARGDLVVTVNIVPDTTRRKKSTMG